MKAGQITAKLRDAVPVCFFSNGSEVKRYKNIDIPDSLKELEIIDFDFDVVEGEKITFRLNFTDGILPAVFPPAREKMTRAEKAAAKIASAEVTEMVNVAPEASAEAAEESAEIPASPETRFNATGEQRKALVAAIGAFAGIAPVYKAAPTFAYVVGAYTIDKTGTLIGEASTELLAALAEQGFTPGENNAA
jgi:hypothetical protein